MLMMTIKQIITNALRQQRTSHKCSEDEDEIARQIAEHVLQHDSSVEDELTETVSDDPEMLDLSLPRIAIEDEKVADHVALNLTINHKSEAVKSGLVFVETLNSSKSTHESIDVSPVSTLCKPLPPDCDNDTRRPVPKFPNEISKSDTNLHVTKIHDFNRKIPNNLLHGPNITYQPLDISSD